MSPPPIFFLPKSSFFVYRVEEGEKIVGGESGGEEYIY